MATLNLSRRPGLDVGTYTMGIDRVEQHSDGRVPERRKGLIERKLPDELILYDPETDHAFLLNHVSGAIWELCDGQNTAQEISEQLASCFNVSLEILAEDVKTTLERFRRDRLLVAG